MCIIGTIHVEFGYTLECPQKIALLCGLNIKVTVHTEMLRNKAMGHKFYIREVNIII